MEDILYKHKKKFIVAGVLAILVIIGISVYNIIWNSIYSAKVNIMVAPYIAKVKIGDNEYDVSGEYKIKPGEYNVEISADGFEPLSLSITAIKGETVAVREYLNPLEENKNWYIEHEGDGLVAGEIAYIKADEANRKLAEENPIMNDLPVEVEYYTNNYANYVKYNLRYETDSKGEITIIIDDYSGGNKELAMERLKSFGYDLSKYKIKYNNKTDGVFDR